MQFILVGYFCNAYVPYSSSFNVCSSPEKKVELSSDENELEIMLALKFLWDSQTLHSQLLHGFVMQNYLKPPDAQAASHDKSARG